MTRWTVFALWVAGFSGSWTAAAPPAADSPMGPRVPPPCHGLLVAAVRQGEVFTIDQNLEDGPISGRLWTGPLKPHVADRPDGGWRTFREWNFFRSLERLHWRMVHGRLWTADRGACHWLALDELPLFDARAGAEARARLRRKYCGEFADVADGHTLDIAGPAEGLLATHANMLAMGLGTGLAEDEWFMDVLPTSPTTWDLFVLLKGELHIWKCTQRGERTSTGQFEAEGSLVGRAVAVGFQEPFYVFGSPESCLFVTKSGKVYWCLRGDDAKPDVVPVWDDPKRRITTILDDPDSGRTFVAGPDKSAGEGKWFYFPLRGKPEPKPFDRSALATTKAEEPLKSALVFARFLAKEGLVKDKAK